MTLTPSSNKLIACRAFVQLYRCTVLVIQAARSRPARIGCGDAPAATLQETCLLFCTAIPDQGTLRRESSTAAQGFAPALAASQGNPDANEHLCRAGIH